MASAAANSLIVFKNSQFVSNTTKDNYIYYSLVILLLEQYLINVVLALVL